MSVTCSSRHTSCKVSCHFCYMFGDNWTQTCLCDVFFLLPWSSVAQKRKKKLPPCFIFHTFVFLCYCCTSSATKATTCWTRAIIQSYIIRRTVLENCFYHVKVLYYLRALTMCVALSVFIVLNMLMFILLFLFMSFLWFYCLFCHHLYNTKTNNAGASMQICSPNFH